MVDDEKMSKPSCESYCKSVLLGMAGLAVGSYQMWLTYQ
jgi:hypothetical protein